MIKTQVKTDAVIYIICGPQFSYSLFFTFHTNDKNTQSAINMLDSDKDPSVIDVKYYIEQFDTQQTAEIEMSKKLIKVALPKDIQTKN